MPTPSLANQTGYQSSNVSVVTEDQFDLAAVRSEWVGKDLGTAASPYPVEYDPIRRFCHMTGDVNPLFLDPLAAAAGPYGAVICPPAFLRYFASAGPWPLPTGEPGPIPAGIPRLGNRGVNLATEWTFFLPARVGDRLTARWKVLDVFEKPTRLDDRSLWICTEAHISDHIERPIARWKNTVLYHRPLGPSAVKAKSPAHVRVEPRPFAHRARPFGSDLTLGDELPGFTVEITPTIGVLQVSGSQDWNLVHHDSDFAASSGHPAIFMNTGWTVGHLSRTVTDWIGANGWMRSLRFQMNFTVAPGDIVTTRGVVAGRETSPTGRTSYTLDVWLETKQHGITTPGVAVVDLGHPETDQEAST